MSLWNDDYCCMIAVFSESGKQIHEFGTATATVSQRQLMFSSRLERIQERSGTRRFESWGTAWRSIDCNFVVSSRLLSRDLREVGTEFWGDDALAPHVGSIREQQLLEYFNQYSSTYTGELLQAIIG